VEELVDPFRLDGDWSRRLGIPAHITLAGPFPLSFRLLRGPLSALAAAARGTRYRLDSVGVLGDAICLFSADERPLTQLREQLVAAIGGGDPEPDRLGSLHLTVCRNRAPDSLAEARATLEPALPISCAVRDLCLSRLIAPDQVSVESL
jgi:hypothetical protein